MEAKSQTGPSFGNKFNNRTEEAIGTATDLWTAFREGAFNRSIRPWLGYLFLLEDCEASRRPVAVEEPHFPVLPEFKGASYAKRYELLIRRLARERLYDSPRFCFPPPAMPQRAATPSRRKISPSSAWRDHSLLTLRPTGASPDP